MFILDLLVLPVLLFLHGYFIVANVAIANIHAGRSEQTKNTEETVPRWRNAVLRRLEVFRAAIYVGISASSIGLGWLARDISGAWLATLVTGSIAPAMQNLIDALAFPAAFGLILGAHVVLASIVPQVLASVRFRKRLQVLTVFLYPLYPLAWLCNALSLLVLRLFGIRAEEQFDITEADDLRTLLERGQEAGTIQQAEQTLIKNVFDFSSRTAKQIMISRTQIIALEISADTDEVLRTFTEEGYSRMPVYDGDLDHIVGIVYAKDILTMNSHRELIVLHDILRPAYFVPESKKISKLLREFQQQRIHLAIVVDEFGGTAGLVTMEDIIEEIVGEIQDEHDTEEPVVKQGANGEFHVNASSAIADINDFLPVALPEGEEYETVGGLLNVVFERIPDVNESIQYGNYEFTIVSKTRRSVEKVVMRLLPESETTEED